MRKKKLLLNTGTAILSEVLNLVFGFIIPRLVISHYGSVTNGILSSITQFLAFFSMMEMGVGAVVKAALYKPLADNDDTAISKVLISAKRFFNKIGAILVAYTVCLMILFTVLKNNTLGYVSTIVLVGAVALSSISRYFFGITNQLLLTADQKSYVQLLIGCLTVTLNTIFSVVLIELDAPIEIVKLAAALVLLLRPLLLHLYVKKHYNINYKLELTEEPIKQKWNGLAQHVAQYVLKHADTVVLTLFSTLENVSIYYVYHLVTNGLQQMMEILTTGMSALLGNMYAKREEVKLMQTYSTFEWLLHTAVTLVYTIAGVLILPFVSVYTRGITDANYIVPLFAVLIVGANGAYCIRLPYNIMVNAAGHFKETQASAIIEAAMNVVISIALVYKSGLVGVAIGTLVSMLYRTTYLAFYLSKHILNRSFKHYLLHWAVDLIVILSGYFSTRWITLGEETYGSWIVMAIKVGTIILVESTIINLIFYRQTCVQGIRLLGRRRSKTL